MQLNFTKMHSLGNDFIVFDAWKREISLTSAQIRHLADRRVGIGCDQILILDAPAGNGTHFAYRIYNANGQAVEQCGNGARCLGRYAHDRGYAAEARQHAESPCGMVALELHDDTSVSVDMGIPKLAPDEVPFTHRHQQTAYTLEIGGREHSIAALSIGNPHAVLTVDAIDSAPMHSLAPRIETHPRFPRHANVGFMEISTPRHIRLRVWERGVGETPGCGTGACAAVVAGRLAGKLEEHVTVSLPGGDLHVQWPGEDRPVLLRGSAEYAFQGTVDV